MQEIKVRQKKRQRTGAKSSANFFRNLGGKPSGPGALSIFKERSTQQTLRAEIVTEGVGLVRG